MRCTVTVGSASRTSTPVALPGLQRAGGRAVVVIRGAAEVGGQLDAHHVVRILLEQPATQVRADDVVGRREHG